MQKKSGALEGEALSPRSFGAARRRKMITWNCQLDRWTLNINSTNHLFKK